MLPAIILFLYHPMEKRTGYCIMRIATRAMAAVTNDLPGRKNLPGIQMARQISVSRLKKESRWRCLLTNNNCFEKVTMKNFLSGVLLLLMVVLAKGQAIRPP